MTMAILHKQAMFWKKSAIQVTARQLGQRCIRQFLATKEQSGDLSSKLRECVRALAPSAVDRLRLKSNAEVELQILDFFLFTLPFTGKPYRDSVVYGALDEFSSSVSSGAEKSQWERIIIERTNSYYSAGVTSITESADGIARFAATHIVDGDPSVELLSALTEWVISAGVANSRAIQVLEIQYQILPG